MKRPVFAIVAAAYGLSTALATLTPARAAGLEGEVDIVARKGDLAIFVEVKARSDFDAALEAIDETKSRRLGKAIEDWIFRHQPPYGHDFRGDAVIIVPWRFPRHIEDAFELPLD